MYLNVFKPGQGLRIRTLPCQTLPKSWWSGTPSVQLWICTFGTGVGKMRRGFQTLEMRGFEFHISELHRHRFTLHKASFVSVYVTIMHPLHSVSSSISFPSAWPHPMEVPHSEHFHLGHFKLFLPECAVITRVLSHSPAGTETRQVWLLQEDVSCNIQAQGQRHLELGWTLAHTGLLATPLLMSAHWSCCSEMSPLCCSSPLLSSGELSGLFHLFSSSIQSTLLLHLKLSLEENAVVVPSSSQLLNRRKRCSLLRWMENFAWAMWAFDPELTQKALRHA